VLIDQIMDRRFLAPEASWKFPCSVENEKLLLYKLILLILVEAIEPSPCFLGTHSVKKKNNSIGCCEVVQYHSFLMISRSYCLFKKTVLLFREKAAVRQDILFLQLYLKMVKQSG